MKKQKKEASECTALVPMPTLSRTQGLLFYFFIYAFMGWLLETIYAFCVLGGFSERGFLFSPLCPIYGFGAIIMILFISKYKDNSIKNFFISAIVFSIFEYLVGFAMDALFKIRLWDYTTEFLNINGRISIMYSLFWGIASIIFINHIHPFMKRIASRLAVNFSTSLLTKILTIIVAIFISDFILSSIRYLRLI